MSTGFSFQKALDFESQCQDDIVKHFETLNSHPGEVGSCKKMLPLTLLSDTYKNLAVVFSKNTSTQDSELIQKERLCLAYLQSHQYPVVEVYGEPFLVEQSLNKCRYGMLMQHINGIFIEAKTPSVLKPLILACLLNLPARSQEEIWLVRHLGQLKQDITAKLKLDACFLQCKQLAKKLGLQFKALEQLFAQREEIIVDLQMLITFDGALVIIDPLDIVNLHTHHSVLKEYALLEEKNGLGSFVKETQSWLKKAIYFCEHIEQAQKSEDILTLMNASDDPLLFSEKHKKTRLYKIKSGEIKPTYTNNNKDKSTTAPKFNL